MAENLTPMFRQYRSIKKQYPDVILLFRLGDFYEMFDEDALIASSALELVLTGRGDGAKGERVPMCGIPFHAVDRYVARLIAKGHRVAICDQVEDPAFAKGLVNRQVTRVVTPGTVVEDAMLEAKANNYLVSLAFADVPGRDGATVGPAHGSRGNRGDGARDGRGYRAGAEPEAVPEVTQEEPSSSDAAPPAPGSPGPEPRREERPRRPVAPSGIGLAVCDLSTGEFAVTEFHGAEAARAAGEELARLAPAELVVPEAAVERATALTQSAPVPITPLKTETFARRGARETLLRHFEVQSLHGFGCEEMPLAIEAAAGVLTYLRETKLPAVEHIRSLATYTTSGFMALDATARRNLELTQTMWDGSRSRTLLSILDATCTAMGGRLLRKWLERPLVDVGAINQRLDAVEELTRSALLRGELREALGQIADLERLVSRCATGTANARDLVAFRASLLALPPLVEALAGVRSARLGEVRGRLDPLAELVDLLARAIEDEPPISLREGGIIRDGFSEQLDLHRREAREGKEWIANLEATERERTGIKSLKVGYNDVFKFYIEVTKPNLAYVPDNYIPRQTTTNAQRYVTAELKEQESRILGAEKRMFELEYGLFCKVREKVGREAGRVLATAAAVGELDALASHAETAVRHGYTRPVVDAGSILHVRNGRHPVVERLGQEPFVPNDVLMDEETNRLLVITGPNMSGKCLSGDTLVATTRGLLPIAELMPSGARVGEFAEVECEVQARTGRRRASHFYTGGRQRTIRIRTRLGYTIEGTPEHRLWVRHPDGTEGWKPLGALAHGDVVALQRHLDLWGNETQIHAPSTEQVGRARRYRLPVELDEDLAYLIGLLIGDGTLTYREAFGLSTADAFIAEEFGRIVERLFGCHICRKRNGKDHLVTSKQVRVFLESLGLGYGQAHQKYVPQTIMRAPRHIVVAFLQGLFDTDGFAENRYGNVHLATSSARMAREVQLLLLNLGMIASLRIKQTSRRPAYEVSIRGADAIRFHRQVGFRLPRKQIRSALASEIRMPNIGGIPYLNGTLKQVQASIVATQNKPVALKHNKRINSIFYTYIPTGRNISHAKLGELVTYCHESGVACAELERLQHDGYFYDRIAAIEPGEAEVYDLSVEEDHSYVAAGFVSHNSTYLRQVALITLMAQAGSMVPADGAQIGVVDRIFTRVGAHDDLASGQSTFMVEMNETANILNNATSRSLVILDEIGRGTSTYDGLSIAWAVAEYLQQVGAKTLFATHYHHLNDLADRLPGVKNYRIAVREDGHRIVWLRKIVPGGTDKSYGIQVGRLAGLPESVIQRAREVLEDLERGNRNGAGVPSEETRVPAQKRRLQLTLFEADEHPILDALRRLDLTTITPIEALTWLHELQKQVEKKK